MKIINSMLENDLYKFSQGHYYQSIYPEAVGTFTFKDRNNLKFNQMFLITLQNAFIELLEVVIISNSSVSLSITLTNVFAE